MSKKKRGVGDAAKDAISHGLTNEEALAAVRKEFPDGRTSLASINWYRSKLRAVNKSIKTNREVKRSRERD